MSGLADLLSRAWGWISEPYQSPDKFLSAVTGVWHVVADLGSKTSWLYLLTSAAIALLLYGIASSRSRGSHAPASLREFIFPRSVYMHPSARVDYRFALVDLTIKAVTYAPLIAGCGYLAYKVTIGAMAPLRTAVPALSGLATDPLALAVALFLLGDFCFFFAHFLMHKIPVLWRFHEVHHSAEVLTPVTVYRTHPVEDLVNATVAGGFFGLAAGIHQVGTGLEPSMPTFFGVNAAMFLFFAVAFQLRHSHLWLSYGRYLSYVLISPAQHQLHHSQEKRHWDKNFGFVFAIWDVMFRTIYVPRQREAFRLGVPDSDPADFSTVTKLYFLPFRKAWHTLRRGRSAAGAYASSASRLPEAMPKNSSSLSKAGRSSSASRPQ